MSVECPKLCGHLSLVAAEVNDFRKRYRVHCDAAGDELFAAGQIKLLAFLQPVEIPLPGGGTKLVPDPECKRLTKPVAYVRKCIANALLDCWRADRPFYIPASTRRNMKKRLVQETGDWWAEPDDPEFCNWDDAYNKVLADEERPRQSPKEWAPFAAAASVGDEQKEIREALELLLSLCFDPMDRQIVSLRLLNQIDNGRADLLGDYIEDVVAGNAIPTHEADVAKQLGIAVEDVRRRLERLESRFYGFYNDRVPTKRRTQRSRVRTSVAI